MLLTPDESHIPIAIKLYFAKELTILAIKLYFEGSNNTIKNMKHVSMD